MKKLFVPGFALGSIVAAAALAGCGPSEPPLPKPARVATCEPGKRGGQLTLALPGVPQTFNPLFTSDAAADAVVRLLFSSLVHFDAATQEAGPGLAESWTLEADQKTWTFKLRQGQRWSDGKPLTAEDVIFTWSLYDQLHLGEKNFVVTQLDDQTVRIVTPNVFAPMLEYMSSVFIVPKHMLASAVAMNKFADAYNVGTHPDRLVGSGPFRLKEYRPRKYVVVERNPEYGVVDSKGCRLPYFDEIILPTPASPLEATSLFLEGKSDACETVRPDLRPRFEADDVAKRIKLLDLGAGTDRDFCWFNQNTNINRNGRPLVNPVKLKWFRSQKFRQAVSAAINRPRMARDIYQGHAVPVVGFTSVENRKWNNPAIPLQTYDPDNARALLREIGIEDRNGDGVAEDADGNIVEFTLLTNFENPVRGKTANMIHDDLLKVGIKANFQPVDFNTLLQRVNGTLDYECALMGLGGGGMDPTSQKNVLRSSEMLHQWFPQQSTPSTDWEARIDWLMDAQTRTLNFAERKKYFDEVQLIWAEQVPMIGTVAPFATVAFRSDLGNVRPTVAAQFHATWNIEELYFK